LPNAVTTTLQRVLARNPSPVSTLLGHSSPRFKDIPIGSSLEVSPTAFRIAHRIGQLFSNENSGDEITSLGGCGLIIDYGGDKAFADSFRVSLGYFGIELLSLSFILYPRHSRDMKLWMSSTNRVIAI
jgi:hypothetical protein